MVDLDELLGDFKPAFSFDALPSPDKLLQLDTAIPLIGGLAVLALGYDAVRKGAKSLRRDDAATARRKREERARLGLPEEEEEEDNPIAWENWIGVILIVGFELALFNLRNVNLP